MPEVQLSDGNVAEVRDVDDMTRGDVRAAFKLADLDGASPQAGQLGMDTVGALQDALITRFVVSWTLKDSGGRPLAVTMKSVKLLKLRDYKPLLAAVAPLLGEVMSGQQDATPDPTPAAPSSTSADTEVATDSSSDLTAVG